MYLAPSIREDSQASSGVFNNLKQRVRKRRHFSLDKNFTLSSFIRVLTAYSFSVYSTELSLSSLPYSDTNLAIGNSQCDDILGLSVRVV